MRKKNGKEIEFICPKCETKEKIPTNIAEMLDRADKAWRYFCTS